MVMTVPAGTSFVATGSVVHVARWPLRQPVETLCQTLLWVDQDDIGPTTALRDDSAVCRTCKRVTNTTIRRRPNDG